MTQDHLRQSPHKHIKPAASRRRRFSLLVVIIGGGSLLQSCTALPSKQKVAEAPPPLPVAQAETTQPQPAQTLAPPDLNQAQEVVRRVFGDKALIDTTRQPSFIAGDFNGDLSPDIAVVVKPAAGKLSEINQEYPSWILKDPFTVDEPATPRARVAEDEILLAVIHGYGANGWSDPQATQTYLLKNAVGSGMQSHPGKAFVAKHHGEKLPRVHGDLIGEVLRGTSGYLYYDSGTYSWYDPKTFKGDLRQRVVHSGGSGMKK